MRDNKQCAHCAEPLEFFQAYTDPKSSSPHNFEVENLVTLCQRCYVVHMPGAQTRWQDAVRDGLIPSNWHGLVWQS